MTRSKTYGQNAPVDDVDGVKKEHAQQTVNWLKLSAKREKVAILWRNPTQQHCQWPDWYTAPRPVFTSRENECEFESGIQNHAMWLSEARE